MPDRDTELGGQDGPGSKAAGYPLPCIGLRGLAAPRLDPTPDARERMTAPADHVFDATGLCRALRRRNCGFEEANFPFGRTLEDCQRRLILGTVIRSNCLTEVPELDHDGTLVRAALGAPSDMPRTRTM